MKPTLTKVEKRISVRENKTDGILNYDIDNAYPQRVKNIVNASGTGTLCTNLFAKFIFGGGFNNKDFYKQIVNSRGLTADKLARYTARKLSLFNGCAFHVNYNMNYQVIEVNPIPFEHIRFVDVSDKKHIGMLAVYDDWGRERSRLIKRDDIDYIDVYANNPDAIEAQVQKAGGWKNYKGQILYSTPDNEYPLAPADSILEDIQTDSKSKIFKFRNITTNFMASHFVVVDEFEGSDDKEKDEQLNDFIENLNDFQGSEDALKMMVIQKKAGSENSFDIKKVDIQDVDKLYEYTEQSVRDNIIRGYLIPPVLLNSVPGKLGTSKEIEDATAYFNGVTYESRLLIEELFTELFKNFATPINSSNDYSLIELKPSITSKIESEYSQKVIDIISNKDLTPIQKKSSLMIIFKMSDQEANQLSGIDGAGTTN